MEFVIILTAISGMQTVSGNTKIYHPAQNAATKNEINISTNNQKINQIGFFVILKYKTKRIHIKKLCNLFKVFKKRSGPNMSYWPLSIGISLLHRCKRNRRSVKTVAV